MAESDKERQIQSFRRAGRNGVREVRAMKVSERSKVPKTQRSEADAGTKTSGCGEVPEQNPEVGGLRFPPPPKWHLALAVTLIVLCYAA